MLNKRFAKRFNELEAEFRAIPYNNDYAVDGAWKKWATSAESLLLAACTENSPHYTNFVKSLETSSSSYRSRIESLGGIFLSAKEAFEAGYLFDVERDVSAEIFGDFVVLAKRALAENNKDVAAVLASAALEDALKRHATSGGLDVQDSPMSEVIAALKSKGLVLGAQKSMLSAMLQIRNLAMHANWGKITKADVSGLVGFAEQFLLTSFGKATN